MRTPTDKISPDSELGCGGLPGLAVSTSNARDRMATPGRGIQQGPIKATETRINPSTREKLNAFKAGAKPLITEVRNLSFNNLSYSKVPFLNIYWIYLITREMTPNTWFALAGVYSMDFELIIFQSLEILLVS